MKTFQQQLREISKAALMDAAITGVSYMKMTVDENTKEITFELLDPFEGCQCDGTNE